MEMYHRNEALERQLHQLRAGKGGGGSRDGTMERDTPELKAERAGEELEDTPSSMLPWIERIESSEI